MLIGGEAGIGKTALAEALCREAVDAGALILVGRCYDLAEIPPYGPWAELSARYRPAVGMAVAARGAFREYRRARREPDGALPAILDFFAALAASRPLVLLLDDLHWADDASIDLLRFIARSLPETPMLVVGTYRSDELSRHDPLYRALPALAREAHATLMEVHR